VVVVDNASSDGSPEMVALEFPEVRLLAQATNLGFTGGHNLAFRERRGEHALPLNSDTVVHPGAIGGLLEYLRANPDVGILGPKLLNPDGSLQFSCRRFPNPVAALFRNTPLGRLFPNNRFTRDYLMQDWDHASPREVDWVSGAAMLVRGDLLDRLGGFDEGYFMYCEDVDLCKRAWQQGAKVVYLPSAVITHAIGRSTDQAANRMIVRFHRSMLRFYRLHGLPQVFVLLRPGAYLLAALALGFRASLFIAKNYFDVLRRWVKR
jgi:GT2 family glycosyltransferase